MFTALKSRKGETLVEVLVAVFLLVVGALGAVQLLGNATVNNQLAKERVIATNLAREGLEAVRSIRDTNWLRFAGERRTCWNNLVVNSCTDNDSDGVTDDPIKHEQNYIASFDIDDYRWELEQASGNLNLEDGVDEDYRLRIAESDGLYNRIDAGVGITDTVFFREIYTEYLDDDGRESATANTSSNVLRVT